MKKLETIMKICTVLGFIIFFGGHILMFIIFPGPIIDETKEDVYLKVLYALLFLDGAPVIIIPFIAKKLPKSFLLDENFKKPDKADIVYKNFEELYLKLSEHLLDDNFELFKTDSNFGNERIFIYYKKHGFSLSYYVIMYSADDVEVTLNRTSDILERCIKNETKWRTSTISVSSMLCVNRVSSAFYKFLNGTSVTSIREYEFRAGYSFGGKTLYINNPPTDLGIAQVKKMKKFLMNMLEISKDQLRK